MRKARDFRFLPKKDCVLPEDQAIAAIRKQEGARIELKNVHPCSDGNSRGGFNVSLLYVGQSMASLFRYGIVCDVLCDLCLLFCQLSLYGVAVLTIFQRNSLDY